MVHYKLIYFNVSGRGEFIRLIFHYAQVAFEDLRIDRSEWPTYKPSKFYILPHQNHRFQLICLEIDMPFEHVPALEVDGQLLGQSFTIGRYLAREFGLTGKNRWQEAQADMFVDNINDLLKSANAANWEKDEAKQKELFDKLHQDTLKPHIEKVEAHLIKNGTGFLVGDSVKLNKSFSA